LTRACGLTPARHIEEQGQEALWGKIRRGVTTRNWATAQKLRALMIRRG